MKNNKKFLRNISAFTYMEILIAVVILALAIVPMMNQFYIGFVGNKAGEALTKAVFLAEELMDEIKSKRFDESIFPAPTTPPEDFGPDLGEDPDDRRTFDDVDDYHGWHKSPPQALDGTPLNEFAGFSRSVSVTYADRDDSDVWYAVGEITNYKKITVTVSGKNTADVVLETMVSYH